MTAQELVITRIFDAPRERVWQAWTNPQEAQRWWGPKDFTSPAAKIDLRVGGKYHLCMRGPAGSEFDKDMWSTGTYQEIIPMEKIVATDSFSDEHGNIVSAAEFGMGDNWPDELLVTVTFEDTEDGKTKFTLRHEGIPTGEMSEMTKAGWNESLDKLAAIL